MPPDLQSPDLHSIVSIIALSLAVSGTATLAASLLGIPIGILLATTSFPGRRAVLIASHVTLALPPVALGLGLYLIVSKFGPQGLLYTPGAMVLAQFILAVPIICALVHRATARHWQCYGHELLIQGTRTLRRGSTMFLIGRREILAAVLTGFCRTISDLGAILIVGGNVAGVTRTMTTAIATTAIATAPAEGQFGEALILSAVLVAISLAASWAAWAIHSGP